MSMMMRLLAIKLFYVLILSFVSVLRLEAFSFSELECLPENKNLLFFKAFALKTCSERITDIGTEISELEKVLDKRQFCSLDSSRMNYPFSLLLSKETHVRIKDKVSNLFLNCSEEILKISGQEDLQKLLSFYSLFANEKALNELDPDLYCLFFFYMSDSDLRLSFLGRNELDYMGFPKKFEDSCHKERLNSLSKKRGGEPIFSQKGELVAFNMRMERSRIKDSFLSTPGPIADEIIKAIDEGLANLESIFDTGTYSKMKEIYEGKTDPSFEEEFSKRKHPSNLWQDVVCKRVELSSEAFCHAFKNCSVNEKIKWKDDLSACMANHLRESFKNKKDLDLVIRRHKICHPSILETFINETNFNRSNVSSIRIFNLLKDFQNLLLDLVQEKLSPKYASKRTFVSLVGQTPDSSGNYQVFFSLGKDFDFRGAYAWDESKNAKGPLLDSPGWGDLDTRTGERILNGLYDKESLKNHPLGMAEINFRRPDSDIGAVKSVPYILETQNKKTGEMKTVKLSFPASPALDEAQVSDLVSKSAGPPYKEMTKDGLLCGLLFYGEDSGGGVHTCEYGLSALHSLDYKVKGPRKIMKMEDIASYLKGASTPKVDYFFKLAHSSGYSYGQGVFGTCASMNYYYLEKTGRPKKAMHFICQPQNCTAGIKAYSYADFTYAIEQRSNPLYMINYSCSSFYKSIYEVDLVGGKDKLQELATSAAVLVSKEKFQDGDFAHFADLSLLNAIDSMLSYKDMKRYLPRGQKNIMVFPDETDYLERAETARRGLKAFEAEGPQITLQEL